MVRTRSRRNNLLHANKVSPIVTFMFLFPLIPFLTLKSSHLAEKRVKEREEREEMKKEKIGELITVQRTDIQSMVDSFPLFQSFTAFPLNVVYYHTSEDLCKVYYHQYLEREVEVDRGRKAERQKGRKAERQKGRKRGGKRNHVLLHILEE